MLEVAKVPKLTLFSVRSLQSLKGSSKFEGINHMAVYSNFQFCLPGKETNTVYSTKLISPETRFLYTLSNNHKAYTWLYSILTWKYYSDDNEQI